MLSELAVQERKHRFRVQVGIDDLLKEKIMGALLRPLIAVLVSEDSGGALNGFTYWCRFLAYVRHNMDFCYTYDY